MEKTDLWKKAGVGYCAAILLVAGSVANAAPEAEHIATMHFSAQDAEVWWEPNRKSKYGFIEVSISGPDGEVSGKFPYGEEPYFAPLSDGLYIYEMYRAPAGTAMSKGWGPYRAHNNGPVDSNGRTKQDRAERAPGQENAKRGFIQSGSFRIDNGVLVDPSIPEG